MSDEAITKKKYAILRFGKIRSFATLAHVDNHNNRKVGSENLINDTPPRELLPDGSDDFVASAHERLKELAIPAPSTRGKVLAVEVVMSASRRWFEEAADDDKEEWLQRCVDWVGTKFGRGLLSVKLHLDEEVWHLHAVALPVVKKAPRKLGRPHADPNRRRESDELWAAKAPRWTLSYEDILGGHRMTLSREQDAYHAAVADLGLERGEKNPEVTEIELGDELWMPLPDWQKGKPRKSIPPQQYRAIIKKLHAEVLELKAAAERQAAAIVRRVAAIENREAGADERIKKLDTLKTDLDQREAALAPRERALKAKEDALTLREKTVEANQAAVDAARASLASARAAVDDALTKAKEDQKAAAAALAKAKQAEDAAAVQQRAATQAAVDGAAALKAAEEANTEAERLRREAQAERDRQKTEYDLHERQLELLARAADDENRLQLRPRDPDGFTMRTGKMTEVEKQAFERPWAGGLLRAGRRIAAALLHLRNLMNAAEDKLKKITAREKAVAEKEAEAASRLNVIKESQEQIEEELEHQLNVTGMLDTAFLTAQSFMTRWYGLPESQRGQKIEVTLDAAKNLTTDWPPAGYDPRKGRGAGR